VEPYCRVPPFVRVAASNHEVQWARSCCRTTKYSSVVAMACRLEERALRRQKYNLVSARTRTRIGSAKVQF